MNKNLKRLTSVFLAVVLIVCTVYSVTATVGATQTDSNNVTATEPITTTVATETTEPTEAPVTIETEPATQPETQPTTSVPETTLAPIPPTIGKVSNIVKTSFKSDYISLEWNAVKGACGYAVYYCNADKSSSYTKLSNVTGTKCTIKNLLHTTQYYFKISALVKQNGKTYEGQGTIKKTATQPATMSGLSLSRSSSVIEFSWPRNSKATGYIIYRATDSTKGKYVQYKKITNNSTTKLTESKVSAGKYYYYQVKAYRNLYTSCTYTGGYATMRAVAGLGAPNYSMTSQLSKVSFSWGTNKYASGYDIYSSTSSKGTFKKIGSTTRNYYTTSKLTNNKTYYFRVQPYKLVGSSKTKVCGTRTTKSKCVTNKAFGKSVGNTYIEVNIKQQRMYMYVDGKEYVSTNVVTGNDDGYHNTPKGCHKIFQRMSPATLVGAGYSTYVKYWLCFTSSGCGIHDASWRSSSEFGGTTYKGNGSHGCVNTPYSAVQKIYSKAKIGTYVVVY